jgi:hypothetical protein
VVASEGDAVVATPEQHMKDLLKERGRGEESEHFRNLDKQLIEKMRERARLGDVAKALAAKLRVNDAELLARVAALGLDEQTGPAILLAPLIQVAWADGSVSEPERRVVLQTAVSRGVDEGSPAYAQLLTWMKDRPAYALFETANECMRIGLAVLPAAEREARIKEIVGGCRAVAEASGHSLGRLLGLDDGVSHDEQMVLDAIAHKLREGTASSR